MEDNKLAADEARRGLQHEAVKSEIEAEVGSEIADRAEKATPAQANEIENIAGEFRGKALTEVVETEREIGRSRVVARISQVIDYLFFIVYALLTIRLILALLAARRSAGFVQFIFSITDPLYAPFRGIVASPTTDAGNTLAWPIVIAIIVYAIMHAIINGLLRLLAHRKTEI
jgi:uncharacterized protein YggT (Ycf19 family)